MWNKWSTKAQSYFIFYRILLCTEYSASVLLNRGWVISYFTFVAHISRATISWDTMWFITRALPSWFHVSITSAWEEESRMIVKAMKCLFDEIPISCYKQSGNQTLRIVRVILQNKSLGHNLSFRVLIDFFAVNCSQHASSSIRAIPLLREVTFFKPSVIWL